MGQRNHRDISKRTLNLAHPTLNQQDAPKKQPAALSDSVLNTTNPTRLNKHNPVLLRRPLGIDCDSKPGIVIHDDGSIQSGYGGFPPILVIFADKFTPSLYPSQYTAVCLDFVTSLGGPATQNIEVVVFDDDGPGGSPGTELGALPMTTSLHEFNGPIPEWNSFDISSLGIFVGSGSVYIGARWAPPPAPPFVGMSADEDGAGFGGGYWWNNDANAWNVIQNEFPGYRAMFIRAVEQLVGLTATSTDPCVGCVVFTQPTALTVNVTEPVDASTLAASDFTVNDVPANSVSYTSGETTMVFSFDSTPVKTEGLQTMHIADGAFLSDPDGDPVHEFNGMFRYDTLLLEVTSTDPPVDGTFTGPGTVIYDVNFNEAVDPDSVEASSLTLSGVPGTTVTGVNIINGGMTAEFTLNLTHTFSRTLTASIAAGAITDQLGNPNAAFSGNYQYNGPCGAPPPTRVLIVYSDSQGPPTQLRSQILAESNVAAVDFFDALNGTPSLGQLQQYHIVVPYSFNPFADSVTLGNNLADYVDGGGIVVHYGLAHYGPAEPFGINGRWVSGGYNAYDYSTNGEFNAFSLGTFNGGHPLMAGVTTLNSNQANIVTPNAAATEVAQNNFGESLVAFRPISGGHTTVGVTAYVGAGAFGQSGDWGKVVVNAGNWLLNCEPTATPTPTVTPTATPTATPRPTPTPRPRPAPRSRPTPPR
jgi:hypothetical protein